jgi:hypothetical protein
MAEFNDETVRELNDSIRELTEVMQSAMGITGSSMASQKDFSKSLGNASSSASVLSSRNKEVATSATNVSTANKLAAEAAYTVGKSLSTLGAATKESKDALVTLGKTMLDTREGMSKYNAALNQAASAAATGLSAFGPLGKVLGLLLKPLTMLVEQAFAFQDNLFAAKDELAKFGAVGQLTTTDIQKMGEASGYSTFEIEKYSKAVSKAGIGLVGLGGSVSQGVVEFTKLTKITYEEQRRLLSLGVTMDDFVENTADFVKLQTSSGRMITEKMKTDGYLQRASKEYTDNLLVLAALSGESVAEQKQKQMALARERESQIADLATSMKIKQLENGTAEDRVEAARLQKKMDLERSTINLTQATLGMDAAKSLQHFLKTGVITPETMKIMRGTGMSLEELRIALSQGKDVSAKFVDGLVKADLRLVQTQGLALQLSKEYADGMGLNSERLEKLAAMQGRSVEEVKKEIEAKVKAGLGNDEAEVNRKKALDNEKKFRESIDNLSQSFQKFIPTFNNFVTTMTDFVEKLSKVDWKKKFDEMIKGFDDIINYFKNFASNIGIGPAVNTPEDIAKYEKQNIENKKVMSVGERASTFVAEGLEGAVGLVSGSAARRIAAGRIDRDSKEAANRRSATTRSGNITSAPGSDNSNSSSKSKSIDDLFNFNGGVSGNKSNFEQLDPKFKAALINAAAEYNQATDKKLTINSAYRDEEQNRKVGGVKNSNHMQGKAVDIQEFTSEQADKILSNHGFKNKMYNQHYEMPGARLGGSFAGPNSGYPVMLHGAETVVPTPNPSTSLIKIEGEAAANKITNALSGMNSDALNSIMQDMYSMMEERLSSMIDKLSMSNDIQDKLLKAQM